MTATTTGRDETLEKDFLVVFQKAGSPVRDLEVWPIPRPTGGVGLCVNFLPVDDSQSEMIIRLVIDHLLRRRLAARFSSLQFAVSKLLPDITKNVVVARYFLESDRVRLLERDPSSITKNSLDTLVTTKQVFPVRV